PARSLPRLGRFVGRGPELDVLRDAARRDRLVTVVGPGGVGKTRLVAELLAAGVDRRAFTVELAAVAPGEVASAVAAAMGVTGDDPEDAVAEYLSVEGALVVLDNCEHVLGAVRPLASRLLAASASVTVLATSRRRLGIHGERLVPLPPLPMAQRPDPSGSEGRWVSHPGEPPGAGPSPAAELVIDRMRLIHPSFVPDDRELADLEALCRR